MSCAACCTSINNEDYLTCIKCSDSYDFACLNLSVSDVNVTTESFKSNWLCPGCLNKQPKNDNTNAPARPSTPTGLAELTFNTVTRRKVQNRPEPTASTSKSSDYVSRADIREIIRDEIRCAIRDSTCVLNRTLDTKLGELRDELGSFRDSLSFLSDQFDSLKRDISTCTNDNAKLLKENEKLRSEVDGLTNRLNNLDQMSRATNLEVQCVPEHRTENLLLIVKQLCNVVKYPVSESDVAFCSRVAKMNTNNTRPRSILVKFVTPRIRDCVLAAVIQYNKDHKQEKLTSSDLGIDDKKIPIYVVENLTAENKSLHAATRLRAKELGYKFVWVRGGRVYVRKSESAEAIFVRNTESLKKLV